MSDKDYLSITAFADAVDRKPQGIYERIAKKNNAIHKYIKPNTTPIQIHISAGKDLYGKDLSSTLSSALTNEGTVGNSGVPLQSPSTENQVLENVMYEKIIAVLEEQIDQQKKELETKDSIIASMNERLGESQRLLDQQQQLALADRQKLLLLEEKTRERESKKWYCFWKKGV